MLFYPNSPQRRPLSPVVIPMVQKSFAHANPMPSALSMQLHLGQVGQMAHPGIIWGAKPIYSPPPSQLLQPTFPLCPTPIRVRAPSSPSSKITSSAWAPSPVSSWTSKPASNASSPAMPPPLEAAFSPNMLSLEEGALEDSSPSLLRPFLCHHCSKSFRQRAHLKAHMRIHSGERPFSCSTCSKSFSEKSTLTRHRRVHSGERPYSCPFEGCMKAFANREPLRRHVRVHTGERPYTCPLCGKSFAQSTHRLVHMRSHSGERPFKCPICSRAFAHKSHVKRHCSAVHNRGQAVEAMVPEMDAMRLNSDNPCPDLCPKLQPKVIKATTTSSSTDLNRSCHRPPVHCSVGSSNIDQSSSTAAPLLLLSSSRLCHSR